MKVRGRASVHPHALGIRALPGCLLLTLSLFQALYPVATQTWTLGSLSCKWALRFLWQDWEVGPGVLVPLAAHLPYRVVCLC